jgi:hypothetical protein
MDISSHFPRIFRLQSPRVARKDDVCRSVTLLIRKPVCTARAEVDRDGGSALG